MFYTPLAVDDYNRANNADIGSVWDVNPGGPSAMSIVSNHIEPSVLGLDCVESYNGVTFPDNQYVQAKLTVTGGTVSDQGIGVGLRMSNAAYTMYFGDVCRVAANNLVIGRVNAGAFTVLKSMTRAWVDGDTMRLAIIGLHLVMFINGVEIMGFTDSGGSVINSGRAGVFYSSTVTAATLDDWEAGRVEVLKRRVLKPRPFAPAAYLKSWKRSGF